MEYWDKNAAAFFQQSLGPANTLTLEVYSKRGRFGHWSNHIFRGQGLPKCLSYEADVFMENAENLV